MVAARRLMQTGLRNCGQSADLWLDYFRMELLFARKLLERRKVLVRKDIQGIARILPDIAGLLKMMRHCTSA